MAFTKKSSMMNLGGSIALVDGAAYAEVSIGLPLNALERQVWVVTDVSMESQSIGFDAALGGSQTIAAQTSRTPQTSLILIDDPDCIATYSQRTIQGGGANLGAGAAFTNRFPDEASTGTSRDYLCIISTPNFFVGGNWTTTTGGAGDVTVAVRVSGYMATADLGTYSALIAEEINS